MYYEDYEDNYVPNIEDQYVVEYQLDGFVYVYPFTIFEGDDEEYVFEQAWTFARSVDTLRFYDELAGTFFNPKTGEKVTTPYVGSGTHHYELQNFVPYMGFTQIDPDELPF